MRKEFIIIAVVVIFVLIFVAVGSNGIVFTQIDGGTIQTTNQFDEVTTRNGFKIKQPNNWRDVSQVTGEVYLAIDGDSQNLVSLVRFDKNSLEELKTIYENLKTTDIAKLENFIDLYYFGENLQRASAKETSRSATDFKNMSAYEIRFDDNVEKIGETKNYAVFIKKGPSIYYVVYSASIEKFLPNIATVEWFVENLEIVD